MIKSNEQMAASVQEILEDDLAFRAWLSTKTPDTVVGRVGESDRCPVSNFLRSALTHSYFSVHGYSVTIDYISSCQTISVPMWVGKFVDYIDTLPANNITQAQALYMLDYLQAN